MGLSVRAGYRSVFDGKKYRYDAPDDRNYLETRFASTGFMFGTSDSVCRTVFKSDRKMERNKRNKKYRIMH